VICGGSGTGDRFSGQAVLTVPKDVLKLGVRWCCRGGVVEEAGQEYV
jgi:hypothetical protein